jgi:catechol-2,3-dioxygenase
MTSKRPMQGADDAPIVPIKMAHFVIRTNRFAATVAWYQTVLHAQIAFQNEQLAFLSFDDEHHRVAIINQPQLRDSAEDIAAIDHVAFSYGSLGELLLTYERLKGTGIIPRYTYNHGMTTSFYYADPNGNKIELQVDNFSSHVEAAAFLRSPAFAEDPVGVIFDPEQLLKQWREKGAQAGIMAPGSSHLA